MASTDKQFWTAVHVSLCKDIHVFICLNLFCKSYSFGISIFNELNRMNIWNKRHWFFIILEDINDFQFCYTEPFSVKWSKLQENTMKSMIWNDCHWSVTVIFIEAVLLYILTCNVFFCYWLYGIGFVLYLRLYDDLFQNYNHTTVHFGSSGYLSYKQSFIIIFFYWCSLKQLNVSVTIEMDWLVSDKVKLLKQIMSLTCTGNQNHIINFINV